MVLRIQTLDVLSVKYWKKKGKRVYLVINIDWTLKTKLRVGLSVCVKDLSLSLRYGQINDRQTVTQSLAVKKYVWKT